MTVLTARRSRGAGPTASDVVVLQSLRAAPAVSILMTTPSPSTAIDLSSRLGRLVDDAERRLRLEAPVDVADRVAEGLRAMAAEAAQTTTRAALALYAADSVSTWFTLPVAVRDRVSVDPTFATRDLVRSLHRTPLHALLVLTADEARLFQGADEALVPVAPHRFPIRADAFPGTGAYLRAVDSALSAHLRARPSPVVLTGVERLTAEFLRRSRATTRWAGTVPGSHLHRSLDELVALTRPVLERYLRSREEESLRVLADTPSRRVASGLDAVWLASRRERPEMLVVEDDLFQPARVSEDGDHLLPADDPEAPDVLDDAVDEVIEVVLRRGGWVALASTGRLAAHGGIALTVRDL